MSQIQEGINNLKNMTQREIIEQLVILIEVINVNNEVKGFAQPGSVKTIDAANNKIIELIKLLKWQ